MSKLDADTLLEGLCSLDQKTMKVVRVIMTRIYNCKHDGVDVRHLHLKFSFIHIVRCRCWQEQAWWGQGQEPWYTVAEHADGCGGTQCSCQEQMVGCSSRFQQLTAASCTRQHQD